MADPKKTVAYLMLNLQSLEHERKMMKKQAELLAKETAIKKKEMCGLALCVYYRYC